MGLEYERSSIDYIELRNHDEWARSWTYFVAFKYFKENGSFDHYWSRASAQISCMVGDRNRCFGQEIQQALIESESEFGVMFGQAERLQNCVFFQLGICILYNHVINYERTNCKRLKSRIQYYSNSVATFQLLIACGDVQTNPGALAPQLSSTNKQNNRYNNNNNLINIACSHSKQPKCLHGDLEPFKPLRFCLWNCQSVRNKTAALHWTTFVTKRSIHVH